MPFQTGERLTLQIRWGIVAVGEAVLEVLPNVVINGEPARHFRMTVTSNSFTDVFYKVRDQIDGYTDLAVTRSLLYIKSQEEGKTRREVRVDFDWEKNEAEYTNFGKERQVVPLVPGTFDPFSILYFIRMQNDIQQRVHIERPITDGKKNVIGRGEVLKRYTIQAMGGKQDAVLVDLDPKHVSGVFEKSRDARIRLWLSTDSARLPLRLQSKVIVGSFTVDLSEVGVASSADPGFNAPCCSQ